jgi:hypothetical protein
VGAGDAKKVNGHGPENALRSRQVPSSPIDLQGSLKSS